MKDYTIVSNAVIKRLPRYRRVLQELLKKKIYVVSSNELGELVNYTASQIRQDLNNFGSFGLQGYGYDVQSLYNQINNILGLERSCKMIIVGMGNLGQAIANYTNYYKTGYEIIALFDVSPKIVGSKINDIEVLDYNGMDEFLAKNHIDIGIITTNKDDAQVVADILIRGGVKGIWNFAPADLAVPDNIVIENAHLSDSLHILTYQIKQNNEEKFQRKTS